MKCYPDCFVCLFRQALNTARVATDDPVLQRQVLERLAAKLAAGLPDGTPAMLSQAAYRTVAEVTGVLDPYWDQKTTTNAEALRLVPDLERMVRTADNPLETAVRVAVAGNVIDLGIGHAFDIDVDVRELMTRPFAINAMDDFRDNIGSGRQILYVGDNSGEIVFDRVLVEQLLAAGSAVVFAVKAGPVINDATREDAEIAGLTGLVPVITTGSDDIGVNWETCSAEFCDAYDGADLVVSKGQGNFEGLTERSQNVYFLLKAKCECVAAELGVTFGDIVFKHWHE